MNRSVWIASASSCSSRTATSSQKDRGCHKSPETRSVGKRSAFYLSMSATALFPTQTHFARAHERTSSESPRERQIELRATLNADKRRIFDALTLPEYAETWLCLPCKHTNCHTIASESNGRFRFDHFVAGAIDLSISGAYHVCRRGKMSFTWQKSTPLQRHETAPETVVLIRLHGEFASSTLCLSHSGLFSTDEYRWHHEMWQSSLRKLQSLF
jgi:uncharacterized protein YndB with AHSA1/START domain